MNKKKFYEFKNITSSDADLYVYGEIVQDDIDWWTGESDPTLVGLQTFKEELDNLGNIKNLNMYINSPGGDVFVASTMISMLNRFKQNGKTINAFVDGLSASAASFLMMVADEINLYKNSVVMVHKPMSFAYGNANEMQKTIDALNKIEDSVMMPMYMGKAKASEKEIKELIDEETWLGTSDMNKYFNVTLLDEEKVAVASIKSNLFKNYKNVPDFIKNSLENEKETQKNEEKHEEIEEKEQENSEKETISEEGVQNNLLREREIKVKLDLIKNSLTMKNLKEKRRG